MFSLESFEEGDGAAATGELAYGCPIELDVFEDCDSSRLLWSCKGGPDAPEPSRLRARDSNGNGEAPPGSSEGYWLERKVSVSSEPFVACNRDALGVLSEISLWPVSSTERRAD